MNEVSYVCPYKDCGLYVVAETIDVTGVTNDVLEVGHKVKCIHCKQDAIIDEITYRLNVGKIK